MLIEIKEEDKNKITPNNMLDTRDIKNEVLKICWIFGVSFFPRNRGIYLSNPWFKPKLANTINHPEITNARENKP